MSYLKYFLPLILVLAFSACESIVEDLNENPNDITLDDVEAQLFLTGAMLGNTAAQVGHLNRISGMYTGQLVGLSSLYSNIYGFSLSTAESNGVWNAIYVGAINNLRQLRAVAPNDQLLVGIAKMVEANAIGTAASIFGDVPYSEIADPEISNPVFDGQVSVMNNIIALIDNAIADLGSAESRALPQDIYFEGDADKWIAAGYTLKARLLMCQRDYAGAYAAAQNGIMEPEGSLLFLPRGDPSFADGDKNLFWQILEGSRAGDLGTGNSYLMQLLDDENPIARTNPKTDETARLAYYTIDETTGSANLGVIEQFEPQPIITYEENMLTLAEAAARTVDFNTGLQYLNDYRAWLDAGGRINANFIDLPHRYDAYAAADFSAGGMENPDGIDPAQALLREIIEERYVSGFGSFMPYDDARRLRASDPALGVDYFLVDGPAPPFPERMPYADDELNANLNAPPEDPGIFTKTEVNQ